MVLIRIREFLPKIRLTSAATLSGIARTGSN